MGEPERFTALYEASYGAIYAYAARRVGEPFADEVAAESFLIAWRRWEAVPEAPLPWLYGVARNVIARHRTASARQQATEIALTRGAPKSPAAFENSGDPALWEAWEQLRPDDREVLSLIAWEELSVAEAARVLECSASVFSVRLHRARRRLERLLEGASNVQVHSTELSEAR